MKITTTDVPIVLVDSQSSAVAIAPANGLQPYPTSEIDFSMGGAYKGNSASHNSFKSP